MKAAERRDLTDTESEDKIADTRAELFRLKFRSATQQLENPSLLQARSAMSRSVITPTR